MKSRFIFVLLAFGILIPALLATSAQAIPAFSRQFKTECTTCHTIFPERNEFGDAFEKNSFVWPKELPADTQIKGATPEVRKGAEALFNSGLTDQLPISFMGQYKMLDNNDKDPNFSLDGGTGLEIFAAGNMQNKVGFWGEYSFGGSAIGDLSVQLRHLNGLPVNVKVGKFKPKLSLWKSNDRSSIKGFGQNTMKIGKNPYSLSTRQGAVELNSVIGSRLFVAAGVTNGLEEKSGSTVLPPRKGYYGHISTRIGGTDFLGKEPEVDLDHDSVWDYLTFTVGGFGYTSTSNDGDNNFFRAGLEGEGIYKRLKVRLCGTYGRDEDPNYDGSPEIKSHFYITQAQYLIGSKLIPSCRFEFQDDGKGITRRYIPCISYAMLQNLRLSLEYLHESAPVTATRLSQVNRESTINISLSF